MLECWTVLTIMLMAAVTYATRILGFVALSNREVSGRVKAMLEAAPGCVFVVLITPYFFVDRLSDGIALAVTLLAASRLSILPTVILGITTAGVLRHLLG